MVSMNVKYHVHLLRDAEIEERDERCLIGGGRGRGKRASERVRERERERERER